MQWLFYLQHYNIEMTTQELTADIFRRLRKFRIIIVTTGILAAVVLVLYAMQKPVTYTSKSSVFPLSGSSDNNATSTTLSALLGTEGSKSFSDDASVNIIELAQSRTTREEVAAILDSSKNNKTIAALLVDDINDHRGWFEEKVEKPVNEYALITWAGDQLKMGLNASINKNNTLVLSYTGRSPDLVRTISYGFINKISLFYIELKREKANRDFQFATSKVDSLRNVMNAKDKKLIAMDKRTLFTNTSKLEYRVPTENLLADKQMIRQQYAQAVTNQQNAAYKLQKATPLIKLLDKPEPPYDIKNNSAVLFGIIGFFSGIILVSSVLVIGIISKYSKQEINKSIFGHGDTKNTTTTASVL
ncbi:MAG: hypothetical protein ABIU11_03260 [Chitinophagaceae bacterium]